MGAKILWVDDEYNRYEKLVSRLQAEGITFDFATSAIQAREKLSTPGRYDLVILDIILPEGRDYTLEELEKGGFKRVAYLGLTLLSDLLSAGKPGPKLMVLTIAEDPQVLAALTRMLNEGKIADLLQKGTLSGDDVYRAVQGAIGSLEGA